MFRSNTLQQLFARRGSLPTAEGAAPDSWTTFQMTLREPGPIPAAFDFTRFLVSSITFMAHLSEVSVYFDDKRLVRVTKDSGIPKEIPMIKGLKPTSPRGIMTVKSIQTTRALQILPSLHFSLFLVQPWTSRLTLYAGYTNPERQSARLLSRQHLPKGCNRAPVASSLLCFLVSAVRLLPNDSQRRNRHSPRLKSILWKLARQACDLLSSRRTWTSSSIENWLRSFSARLRRILRAN
jgi:hypothetical protein